jgi:LPXTG-site transpeptidase (sortase) family protein
MKYRFSIFIFVLFFLAPLAEAATFSDVSSSYKYSPSIQALVQANVIKGYSDGTYKPGALVNRAEFLKMIMASVVPEATFESFRGFLKDGTIASPFYDVKAEDWFAPYVMAAQRAKVIEGYADGSFKPGQAVNVAEALKIMLTAYKVRLNDVQLTSNDLLYVKVGDWFAPYFSWADSKHILQSHKFYHGGQKLTRGELAEMVQRMRTVTANQNQPYAEKLLTSNDYRISIPRLGVIDVNVSAGDPYDGKKSLDVLAHGLGYYLGTPGSGRRMVLFGHSSGYSWDNSNFKTILRQIDQLQPGDDIYVNYHEKGYHYVVRAHEIIPATKDSIMMVDQGVEEMALYTCWPPDRIDQRYVIYADPA